MSNDKDRVRARLWCLRRHLLPSTSCRSADAGGRARSVSRMLSNQNEGPRCHEGLHRFLHA